MTDVSDAIRDNIWYIEPSEAVISVYEEPVYFQNQSMNMPTASDYIRQGPTLGNTITIGGANRARDLVMRYESGLEPQEVRMHFDAHPTRAAERLAVEVNHPADPPTDNHKEIVNAFLALCYKLESNRYTYSCSSDLQKIKHESTLHLNSLVEGGWLPDIEDISNLKRFGVQIPLN